MTHSTGARKHKNICAGQTNHWHSCTALLPPILHAQTHPYTTWCDQILLYVLVCAWVLLKLVCPALPPTGLICEMTQGVKPILSDVSLIVAGSLKAHPQSSPVKAWRIWGLSDSVAITSRLRLSHCPWQGRQRGFRHREREKAGLTAVRHVV